MDKTYTLSQIRQAFWKCFHEQGEFFFSYLGTPEENTEDTEAHFQEFTEELENATVA